MKRECEHNYVPLASNADGYKEYRRLDNGVVFYCSKCLEQTVLPRANWYHNEANYDKKSRTLKTGKV